MRAGKRKDRVQYRHPVLRSSKTAAAKQQRQNRSGKGAVKERQRSGKGVAKERRVRRRMENRDRSFAGRRVETREKIYLQCRGEIYMIDEGGDVRQDERCRKKALRREAVPSGHKLCRQDISRAVRA